MLDYAVDWIRNSWAAQGMGFLFGMAVGIALFLMLQIFLWLRTRARNRCPGILVPCRNGDLFIASTAMREFVRRICGEFPEATMKSMVMEQVGDEFVLNIVVHVGHGARLVALGDRLGDRIKAEAQDKLGISSRLGKIHLTVVHLSTRLGKAEAMGDEDAEDAQEEETEYLA
ncbi:MAG: hypothetical protein KAI66_05590 [Lentisphaeria bacterium]|nr:hypothetical protein [Lentisphaeria bacterium]